jgi:hypothetical protein
MRQYVTRVRRGDAWCEGLSSENPVPHPGYDCFDLNDKGRLVLVDEPVQEETKLEEAPAHDDAWALIPAEDVIVLEFDWHYGRERLEFATVAEAISYIPDVFKPYYRGFEVKNISTYSIQRKIKR